MLSYQKLGWILLYCGIRSSLNSRWKLLSFKRSGSHCTAFTYLVKDPCLIFAAVFNGCKCCDTHWYSSNVEVDIRAKWYNVLLIICSEKKSFTFFVDYFATAKVVWQFSTICLNMTLPMRKCFVGNEGKDSWDSETFSPWIIYGIILMLWLQSYCYYHIVA